MTPHKRTPAELKSALSGQLKALGASCAGYDKGDHWEGPRLATAVYNLVHDGGSKNVSILSQIGIRNSIEFISYSTPRTKDNLAWGPLFETFFRNNRVWYVPLLGKKLDFVPAKLKFADWWREVVFVNQAGTGLSRMNLVFALRSQDGGSHYDAEMPQSPYLDLKLTGSGASITRVDGTRIRPVNAHLATMRHVAYECEQSILAFI